MSVDRGRGVGWAGVGWVGGWVGVVVWCRGWYRVESGGCSTLGSPVLLAVVCVRRHPTPHTSPPAQPMQVVMTTVAVVNTRIFTPKRPQENAMLQVWLQEVRTQGFPATPACALAAQG